MVPRAAAQSLGLASEISKITNPRSFGSESKPLWLAEVISSTSGFQRYVMIPTCTQSFTGRRKLSWPLSILAMICLDYFVYFVFVCLFDSLACSFVFFLLLFCFVFSFAHSGAGWFYRPLEAKQGRGGGVVIMRMFSLFKFIFAAHHRIPWPGQWCWAAWTMALWLPVRSFLAGSYRTVSLRTQGKNTDIRKKKY